jgi:hypothetical protein
MRETWSKLNVNQALSTAFHPQTDGETEHVNQEIEQFLRVFCNYQADNWAHLLPFAEFAHNIRSHSATGHSPFKIWYGFQPKFLPPTFLASQNPTVEERLRTLDQLRTEVSSALNMATEIMKQKGPSTPSQSFTNTQLVWLDGTNVHTFTQKPSLLPNDTACLKSFLLHPPTLVYNFPPPGASTLSSTTHFLLLIKKLRNTAPITHDPPEIVEGETDHYEVEAVVDS